MDAAPVVDSVVNAPVVGVVAPTVPLMLMEAVPVRLVTTPLAGVPRAGVTSAGDVARTTDPVPVDVVTPVPPFSTASVPERVIVPALVMGPPDVAKPVVPPDMATLVTVPVLADAQTGSPPDRVSTFPLAPAESRESTDADDA